MTRPPTLHLVLAWAASLLSGAACAQASEVPGPVGGVPAALPEINLPSVNLPSAQDLRVAVPRQVRAAQAVMGLGRQRLALVLGLGTVGNRLVVDSAPRDAQAVSRTLRNGGFIVMLREDVSAAELRSSLKEFGERLQPGGLGFVYVTGLATQVGGKNLLLPRDTPLDATLTPTALAQQLRTSAVPLDEVVEALQGTPDSPRMLVVDAAYQHPALAKLPQRGLAEQKLPPGLMALFGHALGTVQEVPAVAPLPIPTPTDPAALAATPFVRVLVAALQNARTSGPEALRATRRNIVDTTLGQNSPWIGGDTDGNEEFAEATLLDGLVPRTPEELAREALRHAGRFITRPAGEQSVAEVLQASTPAAVPPAPAGATATSATPTETTAARTAPPETPGASSLASSLGTAASVVGTAASVAATVGAVGAAARAAEISAVASVVTTAASTGASLVGNALALAARAGSSDTPSREAARQAASTVATAAPVSAPVAATVAAPVSAPVAAPGTAPVAPLAAAPFAAPAAPPPVIGPATATPPTATSLAAAGVPVAPPVAPPISPPIPPPIAAPAVANLPAVAGPAAAAEAAVGNGSDAASRLARAAASTAADPGQAPAESQAQAQAQAQALRDPRTPDGRTQRSPDGGERPVYTPRTNSFGYAEGDTFTYQVIDTWKGEVMGEYTTAIEEVLGNGHLLANGHLVQMDPQGRLTKLVNTDGSVSEFLPSQNLWWSNPQRGESRAVKFMEKVQRGSRASSQTEWKGSTRVGRPRKIETPAGQFEVLPIESSGWWYETLANGTLNSGQWTRTVYYAPKLGHPVAIDVKDADRVGKLLKRERVELMHAQQARSAP